MADQNQAQAAAEAPAKVAEAVADTAEALVNESVKTQKRARAANARRAKREAAAPAARKTRSAKPRRNSRSSNRGGARKAAAATQERIQDVSSNANEFFAAFNGGPAFAPFNNVFAGAGERSQQALRRSQQVAEELADIARGNVEALVEAGRVAAEGARAIGQDVVASGREGVEQTADAIRSLAEAKSPTEFVQLQSEFARNSFDRLVAETSRLTESFVKLAGEAIQPISNRATANAERVNSFVA